jgi:hypothetical protein
MKEFLIRTWNLFVEARRETARLRVRHGLWY